MVKHLVSGIPILDACVGKVVESEKKKKLWCRDVSIKLQFYALVVVYKESSGSGQMLDMRTHDFSYSV